MKQLRITPEMMRSRSREYLGEKEKIDEVIRKLDHLITALQGEWEGRSAIAFQEQYQQLKPHLLQMSDLVKTISEQLSQTGTAMEELDQHLASQLSR